MAVHCFPVVCDLIVFSNRTFVLYLTHTAGSSTAAALQTHLLTSAECRLHAQTTESDILAPPKRESLTLPSSGSSGLIGHVSGHERRGHQPSTLGLCLGGKFLRPSTGKRRTRSSSLRGLAASTRVLRYTPLQR